jgi:pimeloyl-ACP methyl ester carboxylesterase
VTLDDLKVTHHFVQLGDLRMHYVERGAGPLVVLLHGFPEMWWSWRHVIPKIADAGFRVIVPDLRGYGETDKHGPYDLDTVTHDVCRLIESIGEGPRAHIVGHDWGGALAWHLAATRSSHCTSLAVLNCPHPAALNEVALTSFSQFKRSWYILLFQIPGLPELLMTKNDAAEIVRTMRGNAIDKTNFTAEELRPLRDAIQKPGAATAMLGWYRAAMAGVVKRRGKPLPYPMIRNRSMLIWGLEDRALGFEDLVPPTRKYVEALRVEPIPNCGHFVQSEQPERVSALLLDFLKGP